MARLDHVITNMVDVFLEYADDGGKKRQLNKDELKKMLEKEIQSPELKVSLLLYTECISIRSFIILLCFSALYA